MALTSWGRVRPLLPLHVLTEKSPLAVTIQAANIAHVYGNREEGCFIRSEERIGVAGRGQDLAAGPDAGRAGPDQPVHVRS